MRKEEGERRRSREHYRIHSSLNCLQLAVLDYGICGHTQVMWHWDSSQGFPECVGKH